jgi:resuscitation-promoting factor RpfA
MRNHPTGLLAAGAMLVMAGLLSSDVLASPADALTFSEPMTAVSRTMDKARLAARRHQLRQRASRSALRARPKPAAPSAPRPAVAASRTPLTDELLTRLRNCEAGGRYGANNGNGYYGAYQFSAGTWRSLGYGGLPHQASAEQQDEAARRLQSRGGWHQWPACSRRIGAR